MPRSYTLSDKAVAALQQALDYIQAHPEKWDQSDWGYFVVNGEPRYELVTLTQVASCGTKACLAGWIAHQSPETSYNPKAVRASWMKFRGTEFPVSSIAQLLLEDDIVYERSDDDDSEYEEARDDFVYDYTLLVDYDNTMRDLWRNADDMADGRLNVPKEFIYDPRKDGKDADA